MQEAAGESGSKGPKGCAGCDARIVTNVTHVEEGGVCVRVCVCVCMHTSVYIHKCSLLLLLCCSQRKRLTAVHGLSKARQDTVPKSVTFADEVAATAHQQQHKRSTSLVEIDIDAAIRRNSLDHTVPAGPQDRGYREVSIDRALQLEDANTTLEVNIDEVIQKRGPRLHRGIMKRTHT